MIFITAFLVLFGIGAAIGMIYVFFKGVVPLIVLTLKLLIGVPLAWGRAFWEGIQEAASQPIPQPKPKR